MNTRTTLLTAVVRSTILSILLLTRIAIPSLAAQDTAAIGIVDGGIANLDTDGDGLSDFQEIHKYRTDPQKKSTAGKGISDGDWDERRQFTYSIKSVIRVMPPYNLRALNDDYQDVRVLKETDEFVELEVVSYPLNTNAEAITENRNWKQDYAGMQAYLAPGVATNWDSAMQKDLLAELANCGIDPERLTDKQLVEQVSRWLLRRCKYRSMAFGTMYADFPANKAAILSGLEQVFQRETGDPDWTVEEEFDHELYGKGMFYNQTRGSCTSSAVLLATVLRAVGIPTRIVVAIPIVDQNDPDQIALIESNVRHDQVRSKITNGLARIGPGFANHTFNEVFVGSRWRRLNYAKLGQNILDEQYFGLMLHVHTFNDLSEAGFAPTWGRRYALGLHDGSFKTSNPYCTLQVSDAGLENNLLIPPVEEHKAITITKASWLGSKDTPEIIRQGARRPKEGEGHLYLHGEEWFEDQGRDQYLKFMQRADRNVILRAKDHPTIKGEIQMSLWADGPSNLREILLVIPKNEYTKMAKGVDYNIQPINSVANYQWKVKGGLTVSRESSPNSPVEEHKAITITKASWLGSKDTPEIIRQGAQRPKEGEGHLYMHGEEWFADQGKDQYLKFMQRADRNVTLRAKDHPTIKGEIQMSLWADGPTNLREILLVIPKSEYAKMAKSVDYSIQPVNSVSNFLWKVKGGLSVSRELSIEETLDALKERLDKLEKRLDAAGKN